MPTPIRSRSPWIRTIASCDCSGWAWTGWARGGGTEEREGHGLLGLNVYATGAKLADAIVRSVDSTDAVVDTDDGPVRFVLSPLR